MKNPSSENQFGKKIGFILESIHYGSSLNLWLSVAAKATESTGSFFVFPGGKLENEKASEYLRNKIYSLVNPKNLDGLISWASSIGGSVSIAELDDFHNKFEDLPFVTIGHKISNHPYVEFDAYSGMKELILHFIRCHNVKRIAFIRGPQNHSSSEDRFRAFKDVLKEEGLDFKIHEKLISSPCGWHHGINAAKELLDDRELVPGKDFDAIIASSDVMAVAFVEYLNSKGYKIPTDVLVAGFNDTVESRIFNPQFSTVHMPQQEIGLEAVNMLSQVLNGKPVADKYLSAYPVIRESCGCNNLRNWNSNIDSRLKITSKEQFKSEFSRIFRLETRPDSVKSRIELLFKALFDNSKSELITLLDKILEEYLEKEGEIANLFSAMKLLRNSKFLPEDFVEKIIKTISVMIPQAMERVHATKRFELKQANSVLSTLKSELLSVHTRLELLNVLKKYLPKIKINKLSLVLYDSDEMSKYIGGFNFESDMNDFRFEEILFDSQNLIPDDFKVDFNRGVFIVQPLFMENRPFGYLIMNYSKIEGTIYEDLRVAISCAIQSIFHYEEMESAKISAEQAEYEKTEFFASVGSDLCDPLKDLSVKVSQIERNINEGIIDADIIGEQLIFLKSQIEAQLEKTETLVDLTRSQVDDLPMDKKLFTINQILPANVVVGITEEIPLLYGDIERLKKAILRIFEMTSEVPEIKVKVDGLHIIFSKSKLDWHKPELLLAEKIILLQYGEILKSEMSSEIIFSWPNLSGLPPTKFETDEMNVFSISNSEIELFGRKLPSVLNENFNADEMVGGTAFVWKSDEASIDELVKVYSLRRNERFFRAPIICFSKNLIGHNFIEVLEQKVKTQKTTSVLFIGTKQTRYGTWATDSNSVYIPSMDSFENILNEITPSLIVFENIEESDIIRIRKNHKTVLVPILVLPDEILDEKIVSLLCSHPRIILCNRGAAESEQFNERIHSILAGDEILPPHTGALVKKAILYLNKNASQQIVRWKLADTVHVSEDYLTRIFHKEIGLSLWEYLNRYRIYLATKMLLETNATIYEIAENSGFQDQAYFCRVFKKIYGVPPGKIRTKN